MINEKFEKIKRHIQDYRTEYFCGITAVAVAGITVIIMRRAYSSGEKSRYWAHPSVKSPGTGHIDFSFSNSEFHEIKNSFNVLNVIERDGRGHLGYITRCIEDNLSWTSQKKAAAANGVSPTTMSEHLNNKLGDIYGKHFERVYLAESA